MKSVAYSGVAGKPRVDFLVRVELSTGGRVSIVETAKDAMCGNRPVDEVAARLTQGA